MSESYVQLPANSTGIKLRTRQRTVGANTIDEQYVIPISERVVSYRGFGTTFRTVGNAATPQNFFSIENAVGSSVLVAIRRISVQMDATAVSVTVGSQVKVSRPTALPTGGTTLSKGAFDTSLTSSASVVLRGHASSDGTNGTAITATAGTIAWQQLIMRLHTAVGQVIMEDEALIPVLSQDDPIYLRANEALLAQITNGTAAQNLATNHHVLNIQWDEFTLP